jgi:hypothetical protein
VASQAEGGMTARIPAIVLTCQRHAPLTEHMIDTYEEVWPDHPFLFRLPDGTATREVAARRPNVVELVATAEGEARGRFRAAVLGLLADLDDEAWVYWCIDDKYPIWVDLPVVRCIAGALEAEPISVAGLSFARRSSWKYGDSGRHRLGDLTFHRRTDYKRIWLHKFLRAKVLRRLFEGFPEVISSAKEMDVLHSQCVLPSDHARYEIDLNAAVFGESTHRGLITANCAESLRRHRGIPEGFAVSPRRLVIGRRPTWFARLMHRARR